MKKYIDEMIEGLRVFSTIIAINVTRAFLWKHFSILKNSVNNLHTLYVHFSNMSEYVNEEKVKEYESLLNDFHNTLLDIEHVINTIELKLEVAEEEEAGG